MVSAHLRDRLWYRRGVMHNEVDQAKTRPVRLLKKQEGWREREESRNARATLDAKRDDHTARA